MIIITEEKYTLAFTGEVFHRENLIGTGWVNFKIVATEAKSANFFIIGVVEDSYGKKAEIGNIAYSDEPNYEANSENTKVKEWLEDLLFALKDYAQKAQKLSPQKLTPPIKVSSDLPRSPSAPSLQKLAQIRANSQTPPPGQKSKWSSSIWKNDDLKASTDSYSSTSSYTEEDKGTENQENRNNSDSNKYN